MLEPHVRQRAARQLARRAGRQGEQQVLGADVGVTQPAGLLDGQDESVVERPGSPVASLARPHLVVEVLRRDVGRLEDAERETARGDHRPDQVDRGRVAVGGLARRRDDAGRTTREAVLAVRDRAVDALAGGHRVGQRLLADGGHGDAGGLDLAGQLVGEVHVDLR